MMRTYTAVITMLQMVLEEFIKLPYINNEIVKNQHYPL